MIFCLFYILLTLVICVSMATVNAFSNPEFESGLAHNENN